MFFQNNSNGKTNNSSFYLFAEKRPKVKSSKVYWKCMIALSSHLTFVNIILYSEMYFSCIRCLVEHSCYVQMCHYHVLFCVFKCNRKGISIKGT